MNKAFIMGNLGRDPELRYTTEGTAICTFSVATRGYKDKTDWHNMLAFGKTAELCGEYLAKGSQALFEGRLQTSSWEKDGVTRYKTEIVIDRMEFVGSRGDQPAPENYQKEEHPTVSDDDDIPF